MNKPRKTQPEPHAPIWSRRIFEALQRKRMTQDKLSELAKVARASITAWIWGNSTGIYTEPKAEGLANIARVLEVSTDYLLGLTDIPTSDTNVKGICEYTGLNVEAVKALQNMREENSFRRSLDTLNYLLSNDNFSGFLRRITAYALAGVETLFDDDRGYAMEGTSKKDIYVTAMNNFAYEAAKGLTAHYETQPPMRDYHMILMLLLSADLIDDTTRKEYAAIAEYIPTGEFYRLRGEYDIDKKIDLETFLAELKKISESQK